jgi:hypothetical protein
MIAKCQCAKCGQPIEFEADDLVIATETSHRIIGQSIGCPNCHRETLLYLNKSEFIKPTPVAPLPPPTQKAAEPKPEKATAIALRILAFALFGAGLVMVIDGVNAASYESTLADQSAIRGTENAVIYGLGFVIIGLSLAVNAICRLIEK